jgi:hypothetical protein
MMILLAKTALIAAMIGVPTGRSSEPDTGTPTSLDRPAATPAAVIRPKPNPRLVKVTAGVAVWYRYRSGHAAAGPRLRAALGSGWRGTRVRVCSAGRCVSVVLSDWCACGGSKSNRLIDLDSGSFARLAPLSRGVIPVTVSR